MTESQFDGLAIKCGRVFTPSTPINRKAVFRGRSEEIRKILDTVNTLGRHAILYGDRGVGKTSLARILKDMFSEQHQVRISQINCEQNDNFAGVWEQALSEICIDIEGSEGTEERTMNEWMKLEEYIGPGQIRRILQRGTKHIPELVIVFDEFDRLGSEWRAMFADTIKDISDSSTSATIILVGVADDITHLLEEHASISRNLVQIKMPQMRKDEIHQILSGGLTELGMKMESACFETIAILAQGYPHFAHFLAKEAALSALNNKRLTINESDIFAATKVALSDNSYEVKDEYHKATLANRRGTLFEQVLISCALADVDELGYFSSTDVRKVLNSISSKQYEIYGFSQHLNAFTSDETRGKIFERRGSRKCYRYKFANPLLRPYAIIKGMNDGIVTIDLLNRLSGPQQPKKPKPRRAPHTMPIPKKAASDGPGLFDDMVENAEQGGQA